MTIICTLGGFSTLAILLAVAMNYTYGPQSLWQVLLAEYIVKSHPKRVINNELSNYLHHMMDLWDVKGASIAVVRPDGEVELGAWGIRTESGDKMTPDTLLNIASCSKAFLAASIGILMDDFQHGRNETPVPPSIKSFTWDTKLKDILPGEWEIQDARANENANVLDILSHQSGLPRHEASYNNIDKPEDILRRMKYLRPSHELRQKYAYNNLMYAIGSHIVSKYSSTKNYTAYVSERIFTPLGMNSTGFSPTASSQSGKLSQTWSAHGRRVPFWYPEQAVGLLAGPAGIITNAEDLSKWMKMLLNKGVDPVTNKTVLPRAVFDAVTTSYAVTDGKATEPDLSIVGYGMGWFRMSHQGYELLSHPGAIPGISSLVSLYPNDGLGIAILLNGADKYLVNSALAFRIAENVLNIARRSLAEDPSEIYPLRPSRSANASSPVPLTYYAGTYSNPGYGSFTLCSPVSTSQYCARVNKAFAAVDSAYSLPLPPTSSVPQLYAEWDRVWSTHVRMVHFRDTTFNVTWTRLFPEGYGANRTGFEVHEGDHSSGRAEFILDESRENVLGFGFFGTDDPNMALALPNDGVEVKERAIAWFEKTRDLLPLM